MARLLTCVSNLLGVCQSTQASDTLERLTILCTNRPHHRQRAIQSARKNVRASDPVSREHQSARGTFEYAPPGLVSVSAVDATLGGVRFRHSILNGDTRGFGLIAQVSANRPVRPVPDL